MTGMDTQLVCVKIQALIYKMERYLNLQSLFFPLVYLVLWLLAAFPILFIAL